MEIRCTNPFCGRTSSGEHRQKLLIENVEGSDYKINITCPRCKTVIIVKPKPETGAPTVSEGG